MIDGIRSTKKLWNNPIPPIPGKVISMTVFVKLELLNAWVVLRGVIVPDTESIFNSFIIRDGLISINSKAVPKLAYSRMVPTRFGLN